MINRFLGFFLLLGLVLAAFSVFTYSEEKQEDPVSASSSAGSEEKFQFSELLKTIWGDLTSKDPKPIDSNSTNPSEEPTEIFKAGLDAYEQKDYEKSIREYDRYLEKLPSDIYALYNRGLAKYNLGRFSEAEIDFDTALKIKPDNFDILLYRGYCKSELEKRDEAFTDIDRAIKLGAKYAEAYVNRAILYNLSEQPNAALKDAKEAVRLDAGSSRANFQIGYAYYSLKKYNDSINAYSKAITLNPQDGGQSYYNRGLGYIAVRKKKNACDDFKLSLEGGYSGANEMIQEYCK
ncbi:tetratricopeptide repeat protein [Leptospira broomii serovar Hurstbridge str. 5399]|uniref:Tetratricopeptide repeat protein n=1 Tax=Leptospira broomii serovar Hurstbridge str. 5399 TaxID=1049789 RepID=T0EY46_9LEPT|nr:tetratricopeptide repeat protein [Leptospira broomii]EQA43760.1 tetratricopeptide repeat protein [Leptospira broomii serovar Hurstbridge str. 5399]